MIEVNEITPNLKRATEIAQICNISRSDVYRYIHRHKLPKIVQKGQKTAYYDLYKIQAILYKKKREKFFPIEIKNIFKYLNKIRLLTNDQRISYYNELFEFQQIIKELIIDTDNIILDEINKEYKQNNQKKIIL